MAYSSDRTQEVGFWQERLSEAPDNPLRAIGVGMDWGTIDAVHKKIIFDNIKPEDRVLDVGCGIGRIAEWFKDDRYVGVDFVPDFIKIAKANNPKKKFIVHDIVKEQLPFPDKEFGVAILVSVKKVIAPIIGSDEWERVMKEIRRVSRKVIILEYGDGAPDEIHRTAEIEADGDDMLFVDSFRDVVEWCWRQVNREVVFLDIGAAEGWVSMWTIKKCQPISAIAVDGNPVWKDIIRGQFKRFLPTAKCEFISSLVLDKEGEREIVSPLQSPSQSSIYDRFTRNRESIELIKMPVTTVDKIVKDFNINNPLVIKIDTELSEHLVWKGMKKTMPIIRHVCMEWMPNPMQFGAGVDVQGFISEMRNDGFEILTLTGDPLTDEQLLKVEGKIDIWLRNKNYGYIS